MATVLVTGTSKGIGLATALCLGRSGYTVFATMRSPDRSPELARIAAEESLPITVSVMDVDADTSVAERIGAIQNDHGPIDVLINNAGIERSGSVEELDLADFKAVMETNYFGAIRCMKAVLPQMRANRHGHIINISSVSGKISSSPLGPYAATKFALEAISESLAQEVKAFGIHVSIVQPGIIDTSMARSIEGSEIASLYPHTRRTAALFEASLAHAPSPDLVGEKIKDIIESKSWQLRHPVGPDAEPFLQWRNAMSDEEWIDWAATDDDKWCQRVESDFGLKLKLHG